MPLLLLFKKLLLVFYRRSAVDCYSFCLSFRVGASGRETDRFFLYVYRHAVKEIFWIVHVCSSSVCLICHHLNDNVAKAYVLLT